MAYSMSLIGRFHARYAHLSKEVMWVIAGQSFALIGGVASVKLLTNLMSPVNYGELALGMAVAGMINMFLFGPLAAVVLRFHSVCLERGTLLEYFYVLKRVHLQLLVCLVGLTAPAGIAVFWQSGFTWAALVVTAIMFGIIMGFQASLQGLLAAVRDRKGTAVFQAADVWLRLLCALLLLRLFGVNGNTALIGYIIGGVLVISMQARLPQLKERLAINIYRPLNDVEKRLAKDFMWYGLPILSFAALAVISQYSDRWILQYFSGTKQVGIYAVLYQAASAPVLFISSISSQVVVPVLFGKMGDNDSASKILFGYRLVNLCGAMLAAMFLIFGVGLNYFGEMLVRLISNPIYAQNNALFLIIYASVALFNLGQFYASFGLGRNLSRIYFVPKAIQALSLIVIGIYATRLYGVMGIAYALLLSSVLHMLLILHANHKAVHSAL